MRRGTQRMGIPFFDGLALPPTHPARGLRYCSHDCVNYFTVKKSLRYNFPIYKNSPHIHIKELLSCVKYYAQWR